MKVDVVVLPAGLQCGACGSALLAEESRARANIRPVVHAECLNDRCERHGLKLRIALQVIECEVVS